MSNIAHTKELVGDRSISDKEVEEIKSKRLLTKKEKAAYEAARRLAEILVAQIDHQNSKLKKDSSVKGRGESKESK